MFPILCVCSSHSSSFLWTAPPLIVIYMSKLIRSPTSAVLDSLEELPVTIFGKMIIPFGRVNSSPTAHHFFSCTVAAQLFRSLVVRVYSHTLTPCTCMAQVTKHSVYVSPKNSHASSRNFVHFPALDDTKHDHLFLTFPEPVFRRAEPLRRPTATAE